MSLRRSLALISVMAFVGAAPALAQWRSAPTFAMQAAQGGIAEVQISRIALDRSSDPDVREFARRMVNDHSRANDELTRLARRKGWRLPRTTDAQHQAVARRLSRVSGERFDWMYMRAMVNDHDQAVAMFRRYARYGEDRELRLFARNTLPTLEDHQDMAHMTRDDTHPAGTSYDNRWDNR